MQQTRFTKKISVVLLTIISAAPVFGQSAPAWDSTYRPGNYQIKVDQFKTYPDRESDYIFLGNSITAGTDWNELLGLPNARNRGISGDISFGVLERLDEIISGKPAKVFVLIGINDIARNIPDSVILNNYKKIIRRLRAGSSQTKIFFNNLLPVNNEFPARNHFNKDEHIQFINAELKKICAAEGIGFIDIHDSFLGPDKKLNKDLTMDGLHLNAAGYERWAGLLRPYLLPSFNKEGHRGARGLLPENTIPSMYAAIDHGVNTLEVDVVFSRDKKVVISHDLYFHPDISTRPDGKTVSPEEAKTLLLYQMPYDSIRKYDVGLKPHPGFKTQRNLPAYKPLLGELIDSCDRYAAAGGKQIMYNIELKSDEKNDGINHPPVEEFVDRVMDLVKEKGLEKRCYLQSFDFRPLRILHQKYPGITTAVLVGGNESRSLEQQLTELGYNPEMYSPHYSAVTAGLVKQCHDLGIKIIPWTVNTIEDMKRLIALGVDGIITDYPDYFAQL